MACLQLQRRVCIDDVRVTTFAIKWHKNEGSGEVESVETFTEKAEDDFAVRSDDIRTDERKQDVEDVEGTADVELKLIQELHTSFVF